MKFEIRDLRRAFTLIEMMVVIAIIGIIIALSVGVYGNMTKKAQQARGRELVSNVATVLNVLLQRENRWPPVILTESQGEGRLTREVAQCLAERKLMSLNQNGLDRCGIVTPWALDVLKRLPRGDSGYDARVPSGGSVRDHQLHFAVDTEGTGVVDVRLGSRVVKVRASAVVWSWGRNGVEDDYEKSMSGHGKADDVFSWTRAQEVR